MELVARSRQAFLFLLSAPLEPHVTTTQVPTWVPSYLYCTPLPAGPAVPQPPASLSPSVSLCPQVSVNGKRLDLTYSFLGSRGIGQCYDSSPCEGQPCQNGATCFPAGEYEFQCLCRDGFKGAWACPGPGGGRAQGGQQQLQPTLTHLHHGPQGTSASTRRTPASSVSPVCMGAPARAPTASVPLASLAHVANKVTALASLHLPFGARGPGRVPTAVCAH